MTVLGEPQLGKRGLYGKTSIKDSYDSVSLMMDYITYCDGKISNLQIAEILNVPVWQLDPIAKTLLDNNLLQLHDIHK